MSKTLQSVDQKQADLATIVALGVNDNRQEHGSIVEGVALKQNDVIDVSLKDGSVYRVFIRLHAPPPVGSGL